MNNTSNSIPHRIEGLDFFRAILAVDALFFHALFFGSRGRFVVLDYESYNPDTFVPSIPQVLSLNLFFLAIPSFFVLSLLLYAIKFENTLDYLKKRLWVLGKLLLFWTLVSVVYLHFKGQNNLFDYFDSLSSFVLLWLSGGNSLYWFFASLIVLTIILHAYLALLQRFNSSIATQIVYFIASLIFMLGLPFLFKTDYFANPLPFLPLIFLVPILQHFHEKFYETSPRFLYPIIILIFLIYLLLCFLDWQLMPVYASTGYSYFLLPFYARLSLIAGTIFLYAVVLFLKPKPSKFTKFIAFYSLSLYCLHIYAPYKQEIAQYLKSWFPDVVVDVTIFLYMAGFAIVIGGILKRTPYFKKIV